MRPLRSLLVAVLSIAIVCGLAWAVNGPQPSVGLYWYDNTDPTVGGGMSAPLNQLLVRTDTPSIYYKSGSTNTGWTRIGLGATGGGGTVTSVGCGTGLSCAPSPIVAAGTVSVNLTPTSCAANSFLSALGANGTGTCTAGSTGTMTSVTCSTGLSCTPNPIIGAGTMTVNLTPTTCGAGMAEISTASDGTSSCASFGSSSLTNSAGANVVTKSNGTNLVASSLSDNGTTVSTAEPTSIGGLTDSGNTIYSGVIAPTAFTGAQVDNYNPTGLATAAVISQDASSGTTVTGLTAQSTGFEVNFHNIAAASNITFTNQSASSLAANRFTLPSAASLILRPGYSISFRYNGAAWRPKTMTNDYATLFVDGLLTIGSITGFPTTTCAAGAAEVATGTTGTATCATFFDTAGTGLGQSGRTVSLNITPTTCAASSFISAIAANGTGTCTAGTGGITNGAGANIITKSDGTNLVASSVSDDGTTWAIATNKVTVVEASGNLATAGTFAATGLSTLTGGFTSAAATGTVGQLVETVQSDTSTGTTTDFSLNATATAIRWAGASAATFSGITGGAAGRVLTIVNASNGQNLTISNESGTAANRTRLMGASSLVLVTVASGSAGVVLRYDGTLSRWMEVARASTQLNTTLTLAGTTARIKDSVTGPALTSCGGSPTVTSGEGKFTITTGSAATGCVATFNTAMSSASPTCAVTSQNGTPVVYSVSSTAVTLSTGTVASVKYDVDCTDH